MFSVKSMLMAYGYCGDWVDSKKLTVRGYADIHQRRNAKDQTGTGTRAFSITRSA